MARLLDRVDYYRLLKVDRKAPSGEIRSAYQKARRRFDPDSYLDRDEELRKAVDFIARRLTEGYLVLRDRKRRTAYDEVLAEGVLRLPPALVEARIEVDEAEGTTPNGKRFVGMAEDEARRGNFKQAVAHLKMAMTFEPGNESFKRRLEQLSAKL